MSYCKQFPIRVTLSGETCELLINALKANEDDFAGYIAKSARALREKIEKYGRREPGEDGGEVVRLGFYEKEGEMILWQFLAASQIADNYRELVEISESYDSK